MMYRGRFSLVWRHKAPSHQGYPVAEKPHKLQTFFLAIISSQRRALTATSCFALALLSASMHNTTLIFLLIQLYIYIYIHALQAYLIQASSFRGLIEFLTPSGSTRRHRGVYAPNTAWVGGTGCPYYAPMSYDLLA